MNKKLLAPLVALITASAAFATPFTETSPTANAGVPAGVTKVGGIVFDARGLNGAGLTAEVSASSLYVGYAVSNPQAIGTQSGLTAGLLGQMGGGFSELAVRVTLFDGDTAAGNFDHNDNTFYINNILIGNWSSVNAQTTDNSGVSAGSFSGGGFRDNTLDTGWFYVTNASVLASLYSSILGSHTAAYSLYDLDPNDNFYDFTQGVNANLTTIELPPVVVNNVPDSGATLGLLAIPALGMLLARRRRNV